VFFDSLGIEWWYEPEGFALRFNYKDFIVYTFGADRDPQTFGRLDGKEYWYLPDFYLPELNYWVEIKGPNPTREDVEKAFVLEHMLYWAPRRKTESGTEIWNNFDRFLEVGGGVFIIYGDIPWPFPQKGNILGYGGIYDSGSGFLGRIALAERLVQEEESGSIEESERWNIVEKRLLHGRLELSWQECPLCLKIGIGYIGEPFCESCHDKIAEHIEAHLSEYPVISEPETSHRTQKNAMIPHDWNVQTMKLASSLINSEFFTSGHSTPKLQHAYNAARSARFEPRQSP
jgi:hypothetical protein